MKFGAVFVLAMSFATSFAYGQSSCADRDYIIYERYDALLEAYPNVPTSDLRNKFANQIGMSPVALKELHIRCSARWANQNRTEAAEYAKKAVQDVKRDCARRSPSDPVCKSVLGK